MVWLGRKRASRMEFTWLVSQFDVSSRTRIELLGEQYILLLELVFDDAEAEIDKDNGGSRGIRSEVCTIRKLVFECNQTTNKGQHFHYQQTKCKEG